MKNKQRTRRWHAVKSTATSTKHKFNEEFPRMEEEIAKRKQKELDEAERLKRVAEHAASPTCRPIGSYGTGSYMAGESEWKYNMTTRKMEQVLPAKTLAVGQSATAPSKRCAACDEPFYSNLIYSIAGERVCNNCWVESRQGGPLNYADGAWGD
jgi:hypothetical protein